MKPAGCVLVVLVAAAGLATVHPLPTSHQETVTAVEEPVTAADNPDLVQTAGFGLESIDALVQKISDWMAPVRRVIEDTVRNRTVSEVVHEATNVTVNLANRVQDSDAFQGAQEALTPVTRFIQRVHDSVKDKTIQQLADQVQGHVQELDRRVAAFIRDLGDQEPARAPAAAPDAQPQTAAAPEVTPELTADVLEMVVDPAANEVEPIAEP